MLRWQVSAEQVWERAAPTVIVDIADQMTITDGLRAYMADHHFQRCATLQVQYLHVDVYRPDCS